MAQGSGTPVKLKALVPPSGDGTESENPVFEAESSVPIDVSVPTFEREDASEESKVADLEQTLTEDELSDLTFAFQALDIDGNGTIEPRELHAMMAVLGAEVESDVIADLFRHTKAEFLGWVDQYEEHALLPDALVLPKQDGSKTKTGVQRLHAALHIPWENKVQRQPVLNAATRTTRNPMIAYTLGPAMSGTNKLLNLSYVYARDTASNIGFGAAGDETAAAEERAHLRDLQINDEHMIFAEYTHMMESKFLLGK
jgi:hypothetical protein|eukprot:COSAG06_NODE_1668_length_8754_cov_122.025188_1_plen_256_part_00